MATSAVDERATSTKATRFECSEQELIAGWAVQWRRDGYVVIKDFLTAEQIERGREALFGLAPTWDQYSSGRAGGDKAEPLKWLQFPYSSDELNRLTLHPRILAFARSALATDDIVLSHSEILSKYADSFDFDQDMHADYGNNTAIVPTTDAIDQVASITYYSDVTIDLGPTKVVSFGDSLPWMSRPKWKREEAPELYDREQSVTVPAGGILLYTMRTFHRGSAFTATAESRYSHHIAFQRASSTWAGWRSFSTAANLVQTMTGLDAEQRSVVGFPRPGDSYWNEATIAAVQSRYPDMDMTPYR